MRAHIGRWLCKCEEWPGTRDAKFEKSEFLHCIPPTRTESAGTNRKLGWFLNIKRRRPSRHPGTSYDTCSEFPFTVLKPCVSPHTDQRDRAAESEEHLRTIDEKVFLGSFGRQIFGLILDWFRVRERRINELVFAFYGEHTNWLSRQKRIERHNREKNREMGSFVIFQKTYSIAEHYLLYALYAQSQILSIKILKNKPARF